MKSNLFVTRLLFLWVFAFSASVWGQTTVTHTFTGTSGTIDSNVSFTTEKNSAGTAPAYNTELRLYYSSASPYDGGSITLNPATGVTITGVQLEATLVANTPTMRYSIGTATATTSDPILALSGTTYTVSGLNVTSKLKIRNANTANTQGRFSSIKVTYTTVPLTPVVTGGTINGTLGTALNYQIVAANNPTSYAIASGTLPAGLNLNTATGIISGTPTSTSTTSVNVTATNTVGTSAAATLNFNIAKANQTISFGALTSKQYGDTGFALTATASSSLAVSYSSSNISVATVSGNTVTIVGPGSTNITASQSGDANYSPASNVVQPLTVAKRNLTISGITANNKIQDGTTTAVLSGVATLNGVISGDDVTLSGTPVAAFASSAPAEGIAVTVTGYSLTGTTAVNYSLTPPSGLTANITALSVPLATSATLVSPHGFTANWNEVIGATGYELEVSKSSTFGTSTTGTITEGFESTTFPPAGWLNSGWSRSTTAADISTGNGAAVGNSTSGTLTTKATANPTSMTFYLGRSTNSTAKTLDIEISTTSQTTGFAKVATYDHANVPSGSYDQYTVDLSSYANASAVYIRFNKTSTTTSPWRLDDIVINYGTSVPEFVNGFGPKIISGSSTVSNSVAGLDENTPYYYRVRALNNAFPSANSNVISATTKPAQITWTNSGWSNGTGPDGTIDALIASDYAGGSLTVKDLTVNSGVTFTVPSTGFLKAENITNNGNILVTNNGNFVQTGTFTALGTSTFKVNRTTKPVARLDYNSWSSPMMTSTQKLSEFSPGTLPARFMTYNGGNYVPVADVNATFTPGQGYLIRTPNTYTTTNPTPFQAQFGGTVPNSGVITYTPTGITGQYVFLGNPYPSAISMADFAAANSSQMVTDTFYVWDSQTKMVDGVYSNPNYITHTAVGSNPFGSANFVPVGQGFFVDRGGNTGSFTFTNAMRRTSETGTFAKGPVSDKFWLQMVAPSGLKPQLLIAFTPDATAGYDAGFDGKMFENSGDAIYSTVENRPLIINALGAFSPAQEINVTANFTAAGNYTISIAQKEGLFENGQQVYLKDNLTGTETDLSAGDYTFAATEGLQASRFTVSFSKQVLVTSAVTKNQVSVYVSDQVITIKSPAKLSSAEVYEMSGKLIKAKSSINAQQISLPVYYKGIAVVKVVLENGEVVTKKVLVK